jgi:phage/conjugal plasmid C-4 type zinc finger TraR family protein
MPDLFDEAQRVADLHLTEALAAHHRRVDAIRATHGGDACDQCGDEIPERRRQAVPGCRYCIDCQRAIEQGRR